MKYSDPHAVWTQIEAPPSIRTHLEWHMQNKTCMKLMIDFRTDALPAHIIGLGDEHMLVVCDGMPTIGQHCLPVYSIVGEEQDCGFLASGKLHRVSEGGDLFTLTLPSWIDVTAGSAGLN